MYDSVVDKYYLVVTFPFCSSEDKPKELHVYQLYSYLKAWEDHLEKKTYLTFQRSSISAH